MHRCVRRRVTVGRRSLSFDDDRESVPVASVPRSSACPDESTRRTPNVPFGQTERGVCDSATRLEDETNVCGTVRLHSSGTRPSAVTAPVVLGSSSGVGDERLHRRVFVHTERSVRNRHRAESGLPGRRAPAVGDPRPRPYTRTSVTLARLRESGTTCGSVTANTFGESGSRRSKSTFVTDAARTGCRGPSARRTNCSVSPNNTVLYPTHDPSL